MYQTGIKTKYDGIYLHYEDQTWWIFDDLGFEQHFGADRPTEQQVDQFHEDHLGEYQDLACQH